MRVFSNCCIFLAGALCACTLTTWGKTTYVTESERRIPLSKNVDVVVIGGSSGAIAAAQKAAQSGASVFLAAPRTYLGDDIAGSLRLWLDKGDKPSSPLPNAIFTKTNSSCSFTYTASAPSGGRHEDSGAMLHDNLYMKVQQQSVEFAKDVTFSLKLEEEKEIVGVELMAFQRKRDFDIGTVTVSLSCDNRQWSDPVPLKIIAQDPATERISLSAPLKGRARFLKVEVPKEPGAKRMLLGELIVRQTMPEGGWIIVPTPLQVKQTLDKALLDAGVAYLTGSYVTDILRDAEGQPAGIVIANRSGRQAITAKVIIDATDRATAARLAGATFQPFPSGPRTFKRIIIAGAPLPHRT